MKGILIVLSLGLLLGCTHTSPKVQVTPPIDKPKPLQEKVVVNCPAPSIVVEIKPEVIEGYCPKPKTKICPVCKHKVAPKVITKKYDFKYKQRLKLQTLVNLKEMIIESMDKGNTIDAKHRYVMEALLNHIVKTRKLINLTIEEMNQAE